MDTDDIVTILDDVYFKEFHERESILNLHLLVRDGDRVLDVGASLGQYAYFLNQRFRNLHITCVEADGIRYPVLANRCGAWTREGRNVIEAIHAAACARNGTVAFHTTNSNLSGSIVDSDFHKRSQDVTRTQGLPLSDYADATAPPKVTTMPVPALTLDSICGDAVPRLVKIDVEGAEYEVVRGASGLLHQGVSHFLIEIDRRANNDAMFDAFARHGYSNIRFFNHTLFFHSARGRHVPRYSVMLRRAVCKVTRQFRSRRRPVDTAPPRTDRRPHG